MHTHTHVHTCTHTHAHTQAHILLEKVKKHKISDKIGKWIREFLTNRKFKVVVNGCMSDEGEVMSGVPQGIVIPGKKG